MKKFVCMMLALVMVLGLIACSGTTTPQAGTEPAAQPANPEPANEPAQPEPEAQPAEPEPVEQKDYSNYTIRIYSNSNSTERVTWLINAAKEAGFTISLDTNEV